jgi:hypothetical protein
MTRPSPATGDYTAEAEAWLRNENYLPRARHDFAAAIAQLGILAQLTRIADALEEANRE